MLVGAEQAASAFRVKMHRHSRYPNEVSHFWLIRVVPRLINLVPFDRDRGFFVVVGDWIGGIC